MSRRLEAIGWISFLIGTIVFLISGIIDGNPWVIAGSALFLVGIVAIFASLHGSGE